MNAIVSDTEKSSEYVQEGSNENKGSINRKVVCRAPVSYQRKRILHPSHKSPFTLKGAKNKNKMIHSVGKTQCVIKNFDKRPKVNETEQLAENLEANSKNKSQNHRCKQPLLPTPHQRAHFPMHPSKTSYGSRFAKKNCGRNQPAMNNSTRKQKELTSDNLKEILQEDPYMIPLKVLKVSELYTKLLNNMSTLNSAVDVVINLLAKSFSSKVNTEKAFDLFLITFKNSNFKHILMNFISELKYNAEKAEEYFPTIATIIEQVLTVSPINGYPLVSNIFDMCYGIMNNITYENQPPFDNLKQKFEEIKLHVNDGHKKLKSFQNEQASKNLPPDDFRQHEIIPTCEELNAKCRPFLRPNIIKGKYEDMEHYLDVQFRLLKEDFIRPLREGFQQYLNTKSTKNLDIKVYANVYLQSAEVEKGEFVHHLKLNIKKKFNIENSKRLMFGNILLLSSDNFKSMTIATIYSRDHLKKNIITVKIETEPFKLETDKIYMAVESNSFFVAYKHTLKALQEITELPLKQYIVDVDETNSPPAYLHKLSKVRIRGKEFNVLDSILNWPSSNDLRLDESQHRALHGALTREMAIIQGPPGTGKTYLGLMITKILLCNIISKEDSQICRRWKYSRVSNKPNRDTILVVCYTNHALDQFLEGMLSFTEDICRVGSRSQSEKLAPYQINKMLFHRRGEFQFSEEARKLYHATRFEIKELSYSIENVKNAIENINFRHGILSIKSFEMFPSIIPPNFIDVISRVSMTFFLFNSYHDISYLNSTNAEDFYSNNNTTFNTDTWDDDDELDEEIRKNEEHSRILDDGGDVDSNYGKNCKQIGSNCVIFEVDRKQIENRMKHCKNENEKFYLKNLTSAIQSVSNVLFTVQECRVLQKFPQNLNFVDRWKLYNFWKFKLSESYKKELSKLERKVCELNKSLLSQKDLVYLDIMKNVDIVGMTTTLAAQYNNILHDLAPPIVIVEEAAEIMEAHVITSLSAKCKHLILIGDHQQLKPKPNVYELGKKFNLDKSFFERMVNNGIEYHTLEYQHRMRPSISNLLVPTIYENLKDHESVFSYPKVRGVKKDLFFIDHDVYESPPVQEFQSYENPHEAMFLLALCRHLLYQDYKVDDITILTPYLGQFRLLKKLQRNSEFNYCEKVRICVLDNYQGEESNIILLSLVRSNEEKKVGFMKIDNRVNVALSRAKHGMFIIGNMSQMAEASELWKEINKKLIDGSNIGPELHLDCSYHPSKIITIKSYEEFLQKSPEGGCELPCTATLPKCGHNCPSKFCHGFDREHICFRCVEPCRKTCELGHLCREKCFINCPPCKVFVEKVLPCGHTQNIHCFVSPLHYKCPTIVEKMHPLCKHVSNVACCEDIDNVKCKKPCVFRLDCGHQCRLNCHPAYDPNHEKYYCQVTCGKIPGNCEFGHECEKPCSSPCGICEVYIDRQLKCGHMYKNIKCGATEKSIKCKNKCERTLDCGHKCPKLCFEKCGDCMEKVSKLVPGCRHMAEVPCSVLPSEKFCFGKCERILPCGHQCTLKCKDICTSNCLNSVESSFKCPKNHPLKIPCYINQELEKLSLNPRDIGEYCIEACGETLNCGHLCKGKCGECFNGRIHLVCEEKCSKYLICGHMCPHDCSSCCSSCDKFILWKCRHQKPRKIMCGKRLKKCQKPCVRGCRHSTCKAKCGEPCSFQPCTQTCQRKLKCGHFCIGYCGDKCPKLCFTCDKDDVEALTKGTDYTSTRFVELEDCGHVFEGVWMDSFMNSSLKEENMKIGMKTCPKCHVLIIKTKRYWNSIIKNYEDVSKAYSGFSQYVGKFDKKNLVGKLKVIQSIWHDEVCTIRVGLNLDQNFREMSQSRNLNVEKYMVYEFQLDLLKKAVHLKTVIHCNKSSLTKLVDKLMKCTKLSQQAAFEFSCELRRIDLSTVLQKTQRVYSSKNLNDNDKLNKLECLFKEIELMNPKEFDENAEGKIIMLLKEIEMYKYTSIFKYEHKQLFKTANLNQENWYKCKKGHAYFSIDESNNEANCLYCNSLSSTPSQTQGNSCRCCLNGHSYFGCNNESNCLYCKGPTPNQSGNQNKKKNFNKNYKKFPKRK